MTTQDKARLINFIFDSIDPERVSEYVALDSSGAEIVRELEEMQSELLATAGAV